MIGAAYRPEPHTLDRLSPDEAIRDRSGQKHKHYYVRESVGIAVGFLLAALHLSGLATLTHAPSPMRFLSEILVRREPVERMRLRPVGGPDHAASSSNRTSRSPSSATVVATSSPRSCSATSPSGANRPAQAASNRR